MNKHPVIFTYAKDEITISFPDIPKERLVAKSQEEARAKTQEYLNRFFESHIEDETVSLSEIRLKQNQSIHFL